MQRPPEGPGLGSVFLPFGRSRVEDVQSREGGGGGGSAVASRVEEELLGARSLLPRASLAENAALADTAQTRPRPVPPSAPSAPRRRPPLPSHRRRKAMPDEARSSRLYLSVGEAERLQSTEAARRRMARLNQVREQEKKLAAEKRSQYQKIARRQLEETLYDLKNEWECRKEDHLQRLQCELELVTKDFGKAHGDAQKHTEITRQTEKLKEKLLRTLEKEEERLRDSCVAVREEQFIAEYPSRLRYEQFRRASDDARKRAALVVEFHRRKLAADRAAFAHELPPELRRVTPVPASVCGTYYHVARPVPASEQPEACIAAENAEKRRRDEEGRQSELDEGRRQTERCRFDKALYDVRMREGRKLLDSQLRDLFRSDAKRRQDIMLKDARCRRFHPTVI